MHRKVGEKVWQADEADARRLCEGENDGWKALGVKGILCPAFNVRIPYHPKLSALVLPVWDDTDATETMFDAAVAFHRALGPTLVHCHGGLNRSSAFAAALLVDDGAPLDQAIKAINAIPWPGLLNSLRRWAAHRGK
jgi:protein-tyrosine phosphatase